MISEYLWKQYIRNNRQLHSLGITEETPITFLAQGEYNINYLVFTEKKKFVLRINIQSQLQLSNQIKYEYDSLVYLEKSNVTPKVYYVDDTKEIIPYGLLIMEYLEGRPLNYETDLGKAATIFGNIHSLEMKEPYHFIVEEDIFTKRIKEAEFWMENVWESKYLSVKVLKKLEKLLSYAYKNENCQSFFINQPWHCINNTEVNSHNFIIGENKDFLIDWEKPVISDPTQDITQFLSPTTTLWKTDYLVTLEEKAAFFQIYENSLGMNSTDIRFRVELYEPYLLLRALTWCANAYVSYHDPNKIIKNEDTFNKISIFLEETFLDNLINKYR